MSIRLRLTLWYSGLIAITMLVLGVGIYLFVTYNTYEATRNQLRDQYNRLRVVPSIDMLNGFQLSLTPRVGYEGIYTQLVNYVNGDVKSTAYTAEGSEVEFPYPKLDDELQPGFVEFRTKGYNFLAYQVPLQLNGETVGLLQVVANTTEEETYLHGLRTILVFSTVVAILTAFTIGLFLARKALRPIEDVIVATNRIENGSNLSVRIPRGGADDEMGRLTDTLNGMLTRLERTYNDLDDAYKAQRRFVSDASHELRTPLTTIRGNIDLLEKIWRTEERLPDDADNRTSGETGAIVLDRERAEMSLEAMRDISEESRRMTRLVSDMLSLARADAGYAMEMTDVELKPLVEEVSRRAVHLPRQAEWQLGDLSVLADVHVQGNPDYLRQLLFIFIENAFKYTPEGVVELRAMYADGQAGLVIADTGIGMNSEEVPLVFERFYRADLSRGKTAGTGLGLAIAKWIIDEHRGSVEVRTREGEGTTFVIWLPCSFPAGDGSAIIEETDRTESTEPGRESR